MLFRIALFGLALTAVQSISSTTPASADDHKGYDAPFSWTGIYVGGTAGASWLRSDYLTNHITGIGPCAGAGLFAFPCDPVDHDASGFLGGGQVGARMQSDHWVFGAEGTYSWTNLDDTTKSTLFPTLNYSSDLKSIYTATAQVGYAWDQTLLYLKGGYAGGHLDFDSFSGAGSLHIPASTNVNGWTLGTGIEHALNKNLSIGVEYGFTRLEGEAATCSAPGAVFSCPVPPGVLLRYADYSADVHQVDFRLNFRFAWEEPSVSAPWASGN